MGPAAATAWRKGEVKLRDFVGVRENKDWGDSVFHDSLKGARERASQRERNETPKSLIPKGGAGQNTERQNARQDVKNVPLGNSLGAFVDIPADKAFAAFRDAINEAQAAHGLGNQTLPPITARFSALSDPLEEARYTRLGKPQEIAIRRNAAFPRMVFLHENGHYLDDQALGTAGRWASQDAANAASPPVLTAWLKAVQSSKAFADLEQAVGAILAQISRTAQDEEDLKYARYYLQKEELWARSYSQYVATRSGSTFLKQELDGLRAASVAGRYLPAQWDDADFEPIAAAIDETFRKLGWIQ